MSDTDYTQPTREQAENAVLSLNSGGADLWHAVSVLLAHAGLPSDPASVRAALAVRNALAMLDDPRLA